MRLTVDVNFIDDAVQWKETDHPRKKGGEFTKKGTGEPSGKTPHWGREHKGVPLGNEYAAHVKIHKIATASGMLKDGSLGIAVNKGKEAPKETPKEALSKKALSKEDEPTAKSAPDGEEDDDSDVHLDENEYEGAEAASVAPPKSELVTPSSAGAASIPLPHASFGAQKDLYEVAISSEFSLATKAIVLNTAITSNPGSYTAKYAEEVKKALGIESSPSMTVASPRMKRFAERFDAAYHPNDSLSEATLKKRIPTASKSTWETFPEDQRASIAAYTRNSYKRINRALRDPEEATAATTVMITAIDDAFESEHARIAEDTILYRGFKLPDEVITKLTKAVEKGLPARFDQQGFVSTSLKSQTAYAFSTNVIMQILARKGTPALYLKPLSGHKNEEEVLLRHGQSFEVVSITKYSNIGKFLIKVVAN